ncbi:hypothetical protein GGR34_003338 [Microvirga flocculans]|uniref:TniQ domain-containing protein n=1 Tax=Microvirga flocculans TaxID=217168 RepID=A0A7W6IHL4_9HYPH|nr:TniQ family protein [Microvirga flocculans]MBB4041660.1 hypothetical protein [Microvirga flocculans]
MHHPLRPVLFPVRPHPGESLASLLARTADSNNYDNAGWLVDVIGATRRQHLWTAANVEAAARLLGLAADDVASRAYLRKGEVRNFLGHRLRDRALEKEAYKHCPKCLADHGYHRATFDLVAIDACPRHECRLASACHRCGKPYLRSQLLFECYACKADRRNAPVQAVPPERLQGTAWLARLAGFGAIRWQDVPAALAHLSLDELSELLITLGALDLGVSLSGGAYTAIRRAGDKFAVLQAGYDAVSVWPEGFRAFLREVSARNNARRRRGSPGDLGRLWSIVSSEEREPWLTLRHQVAAYIAGEWSGIVTGPTAATVEQWLGQPLPYVPLEELRARVGRSERVWNALVLSGIVKTHRAREPGGRRVVALDRASLDAVCPSGQPLIGLKEMALHVGLPFKLAQRLVAAGVIPPLLGPSRSGAARLKNHFFARPQIDAFVQGLIASPRIDSTRLNKTWSFKSLMKAQEAAGVDPADVLAAIRNRRLPAFSTSGASEGLGGLAFDGTQARRLLAELQEAGSGDVVSVAWACRLLGVHSSVVHALVKAGHLDRMGSGKWIRLSRRSVEAFNAEWIACQHVAPNHKVTSLALNRALLKVEGIGVLPVAARHRSPFYRRADIARLPLVDLLQRPRKRPRHQPSDRKR